jgi:hypothetical protein
MMSLKTLNGVLAASLLAGATLAQAASYDVSGTLDSFSSNPAVISAIFNPTAPAFTGSWNVDTLSLSGTAGFGAYSAEWSLLGSAVGTTSYTYDNYSLSTTTASYDAGTRTLTVNGTLANTSADYSCTGDAFFCDHTLPSFDLSLTLTFTDDTLKAFNGSLVSTNGDVGGQYGYAWSFNGETPEVPVPAAVWLFGSGLAGLAGLARSRKS